MQCNGRRHTSPASAASTAAAVDHHHLGWTMHLSGLYVINGDYVSSGGVFLKSMGGAQTIGKRVGQSKRVRRARQGVLILKTHVLVGQKWGLSLRALVGPARDHSLPRLPSRLLLSSFSRFLQEPDFLIGSYSSQHSAPKQSQPKQSSSQLTTIPTFQHSNFPTRSATMSQD